MALGFPLIVLQTLTRFVSWWLMTRGLAGAILAIAFARTDVRAIDSNIGESFHQIVWRTIPSKKMCKASFLFVVFGCLLHGMVAICKDTMLG
jgi:hypothetical protein